MITPRRLMLSITAALLVLAGAHLLHVARPVEAAAAPTAATGGGSISVDTAATAAAPAWTTLTGPMVITEGLATDIAVEGPVTIIFSAPAGFEFNTSVAVDVAKTGADITSVVTPATVGATTITVTYTAGGTATLDTITIGGTTPIQVRPTGGTPATGNITRTGGSGTAIAGITGASNFGTLTSVAGAVAQLGITTQPAGATAGAVFTTQPVVRTEDQFANPSTSGLGASLTVTAALTTGTGPLQGTAALDIGTGAGTGTVTYTDLRLDVAEAGKVLTFSATGLTSIASGGFAVAHGAATQLAVTTPPSASTAAGAAFAQQPIATIRDAFGNTVTGDSTTVVTAALTGGAGTLSGTATETAASGIADFAGNGLSIDLVGADKVLTFSAGGLTSAATSTFAITAAAASGATSTITASPTTITADGVSTSMVTAQLRDAGSNALSAGGDTVVLATTLGSLSGVTDVGDGTYTATLTSSSAGSATVSGTVNAGAITDTAVVTLSTPVPPPSPPAPATTTTVVDSGLTVAVTDESTIEVAGDGGVALAITTESGTGANVSVTEGTLPAGSTLSLSAVQAIETLIALAPPPSGVTLVSAFVVRATDPDGVALTEGFETPVRLEFRVDRATLPAGALNDELAIVFWDGSEWVGLVTTATGGTSVTLVAEVGHLTLFGVAHGVAALETEGAIRGDLPAAGFGLVTFGGSILELEAALVGAGCLSPIFATAEGAFVGYFPTSAVDLVNAPFRELFSSGIALRTPLLGGQCGP